MLNRAGAEPQGDWFFRILALALAAIAMSLPRFGFEVFLKEAILRKGLRTAILCWREVASSSKP
jgi:hypothetical protein